MPQALNSARNWIASAYEFARLVWRDYVEDHGNLVAAAVSFYVFLALVPVLVLGIAIVGYVLGSPTSAEDIVLSVVRSSAPGLASGGSLAAIKAAVNEVVAGRELATGFGLLTLLWIGTTVIASLDQAINVAWGLGQRRFMKKRVLALAVLVLVGILLGLSFVITTALNAVRLNDITVLGVSPSDWPWVWTLLAYLLPVALSILTFSVVYHLIPNTSVHWRVALAGGLFAGLLWEVGKYGFSYYVSRYTNYSAVYGSLAGIILLQIWIYFSSVITIMGAEVASVYAGRRMG